MFGYVKATECKLKAGDREIYQGAYCGLCKALGKNYGQPSRLTLSFDLSFLALLILSQNDEAVSITYKRCKFNFKKKPFLTYSGETYKYITSVSMILNYYKLLDNIDDKSGIKKIGFILLKPYFSHKKKRAGKWYPQVEKAINSMYEAQRVAEQNLSADIDMAAEPTAKALSIIFSLPLPENKEKMEKLGYCLGKWIYLIDAVDDIEKDRKQGNFNPLITDADIRDDSFQSIKEQIEPVLCNCISVAYECYKKSKILRYGEIIENILQSGLDCVKEQIFENKIKAPKEESNEKLL